MKIRDFVVSYCDDNNITYDDALRVFYYGSIYNKIDWKGVISLLWLEAQEKGHSFTRSNLRAALEAIIAQELKDRMSKKSSTTHLLVKKSKRKLSSRE